MNYRRCLRRSPACRASRLQPAAGAQGELAALLLDGRRVLPRPGRDGAPASSFPVARTAPIPASAAVAGFECVQMTRSKDRAGRSRRTQVGGRRPHRRLHADQPEHAGAVRGADRGNRGNCCTRPAGWSTSTGRTSTRSWASDAAGRLRRRHDALQRPQDLHRPARRRRPRRRPDRRPRLPRRLPARPRREAGRGTRDEGRESRHVRRSARGTQRSTAARSSSTTPPKSIGRVRSHFGNVGILLRGWFYLRTLGAGRRAGGRPRTPVLNANYLKTDPS